MAELDLSLSDALTDSVPQPGPESLVERDFVAQLEAETFDDQVGETVGKTDYIPLLDNDDTRAGEASGYSTRSSRTKHCIPAESVPGRVRILCYITCSAAASWMTDSIRHGWTVAAVLDLPPCHSAWGRSRAAHTETPSLRLLWKSPRTLVEFWVWWQREITCQSFCQSASSSSGPQTEGRPTPS